MKSIKIGKSKLIRDGENIAYLVFGTLINNVKLVAEKNNATVVDMRFAKPIDEKMIIDICNSHEYIFTVEDNAILGGAGSAVNEVVVKNSIQTKIVNLGVPDKMIPHGNQDDILSDLGLDVSGIMKTTNDHIASMVKLNKQANKK